MGIRELQRDTSAVVDRVARSGRPAFITKRGHAIAVAVPVDPDALEDHVLANAPEYVRSMGEADRALTEGRTRTADKVFAEIGATSASVDEPAGTSHLTERELDILRLLAAGRTNRDIALEFDISAGTVLKHVKAILEKLGVSRRIHASD